MAKRKAVDIAVIIPDASPILTLSRIGRLDLLNLFDAPIHLVDQVKYEVMKPENDPTGVVAAFLKRNDTSIETIETTVGTGFQVLRARGDDLKSRNLGETAVAEYTINLKRSQGPSFVPLVLFEDPDVLEPADCRHGWHLLAQYGGVVVRPARDRGVARRPRVDRQDQRAPSYTHGAHRPRSAHEEDPWRLEKEDQAC